MKYGAMLRTLREERGLSQSELARRAGMSSQGVCQQESGERKQLLFDSVVRLARALEVPVDRFAECDEFRPKKPR
jgi:transcriptional regulator with XRE-family HTH domain